MPDLITRYRSFYLRHPGLRRWLPSGPVYVSRWPYAPAEINRIGRAFAAGIQTALSPGPQIDRLRLPAEIRQYCNDPRWHIITSGPLKDTALVFDWSGCPGSLYEDYDTARQAALVAAWWGYEPMLTEPCPSHQIARGARSRSAPGS